MRSKLTALAVITAMTTGCSRERIVLGWDRPVVVPDRYRVFVDDRLVQEIPPPPLNPVCHCLTISFSVSRGPHTIQVVAYNVRGGISPPATLTVQ
jgi:hypothetical protein